MDRHVQLFDPIGEEPFDALLAQSQQIVVPCREVADVERDVKADIGVGLPLGEKAVNDAALVEHFQRTRMQPAGAAARYLHRRSPLDDRDIDAAERQFACQHQTGRAAAGNDDLVFGHLPPRAMKRGLPSTTRPGP